MDMRDIVGWVEARNPTKEHKLGFVPQPQPTLWCCSVHASRLKREASFLTKLMCILNGGC
jgi:hypothetical protein